VQRLYHCCPLFSLLARTSSIAAPSSLLRHDYIHPANIVDPKAPNHSLLITERLSFCRRTIQSLKPPGSISNESHTHWKENGFRRRRKSSTELS
jgi:hypothetical protein